MTEKNAMSILEKSISDPKAREYFIRCIQHVIPEPYRDQFNKEDLATHHTFLLQLGMRRVGLGEKHYNKICNNYEFINPDKSQEEKVKYIASNMAISYYYNLLLIEREFNEMTPKYIINKLSEFANRNAQHDIYITADGRFRTYCTGFDIVQTLVTLYKIPLASKTRDMVMAADLYPIEGALSDWLYKESLAEREKAFNSIKAN